MIFTWVSKVIQNCVGSAVLRCVMGLEISSHFLKFKSENTKIFFLTPYAKKFRETSANEFLILSSFMPSCCCKNLGVRQAAKDPQVC